MDNNQLLTIIVKSPTKTEYSGQAKALTSYNMRGKFDILGYHANFISIIEQMVIIHQENKQEVKIGLEKGIMKVSRNTVTVLIGVHFT